MPKHKPKHLQTNLFFDLKFLFYSRKVYLLFFFEGISTALVFEETFLLCKVQVSATTKIIKSIPVCSETRTREYQRVDNSQLFLVSQVLLTMVWCGGGESTGRVVGLERYILATLHPPSSRLSPLCSPHSAGLTPVTPPTSHPPPHQQH